jgi:hypothetical protein
VGQGTRSESQLREKKRMHVTLEIVLAGKLVLPVSGEVNTLADVAKLGKKLATMPPGAMRLMPVVRTLAVETIRATETAGDAPNARRSARRGRGSKRGHGERESAAAASA